MNAEVVAVEGLIAPVAESSAVTVRSTSKVDDETEENETKYGCDLDEGEPELRVQM